MRADAIALDAIALSHRFAVTDVRVRYCWWEQAKAAQARILARLEVSQKTKHTQCAQPKFRHICIIIILRLFCFQF